MTTLAHVQAAVAKIMDIPRGSVTPGCTWESLEADSFDRIEIMMEIEESLGVEIQDADWEGLADVRGVVEMIDRKLAG